MSKKIGIRYCGGCNPKFDRVEMVHEMIAAHPDWDVVYMDRITEADDIYIISGCERECTSVADLSGKNLIKIHEYQKGI